MNYKSNLAQPDIWHHFQHLTVGPMAHSFGHDVPRDWADKADDDPVFGIWKQCGSFTQDEGAILAACAAQYLGGVWVDIGCNTGVISKLINWMTNAPVLCVDYMLADHEFFWRFEDNTGFPADWTRPVKSEVFFRHGTNFRISGFVIDGDHDRPQPMWDALNACRIVDRDGVILLHDFWGAPVQDAVSLLINEGFKARVYTTPHGIAVCWRGGHFKPPEHVPDPSLPDLKGRCPNFNFERCS